MNSADRGWTIFGCVFIAALVAMTCVLSSHSVAVKRAAFENGYEQVQEIGNTGTMWVKGDTGE